MGQRLKKIRSVLYCVPKQAFEFIVVCAGKQRARGTGKYLEHGSGRFSTPVTAGVSILAIA
jgi:hypothetical protein